MAIQFNSIPNASLRVPLFYAELNGAQTPYVSISRLLLLGQMNGGGGAVAGQPTYVNGDARDLFGQNSMLADMVNRARLNAPFQEIWALPMMDSGSGVAATGKVKLPRALTAVVATITNIADLAAGAPATVDGVSLNQNDLVLVAAQTDKSKNGLYKVDTLGAGANGAWTRAASMDAAGEVENGLVITPSGGTNAGKPYRVWRGASMTLNTTPIEITQGGVVVQAVTLSLWIADVQVQTIAYASDTGVTLAARLVAAINAKTDCPVTAVVNGSNANEVDLTARHKGTCGNSIYLDTDYYGTEGPMAAALFTITQMSGGTGDPDFTSALANLGDEEFDWMVGPYTDPTHLAAIDTFLNGQSGRWSPYLQLYGHYLGVRSDSISNLLTYGSSLNTATTSTFGINKGASPNWAWAGALGGRMAAHLSDAPELSRPLQSLELIGILPPKKPSDRPNINERNSLYWAGISSFNVTGKTKQARIDRVVTNYRLNVWGSPDASWLDVETRAQSMFITRTMKAAITGNFPRAALMDENPEGVQGVATPRDIRNVLVHEYKRLEALGVVENSTLFAESVIVERNIQDANRVDAWLPIDVVNQLRVFAANVTIFLQRERQAA